MNKIIYDLGSNNGDNISYYLKKADLVIAVEADPLLCDQIHKKFSNEISKKKLIIENVVLTDKSNLKNVVFYRHKKNKIWNQFPKPKDIENFEEILLPSKSIIELISEHGFPYYIKIDLEYYDQVILKTLFENDIRPPFISAESHSVEIFSLMVALGRYNAFKLVDGQSVSQVYHNHKIKTIEGFDNHVFPPHSAGPFGEDINGEWMTANNFFRFFSLAGLGWKDIHATNIQESNPYIFADIQNNISIIIRDGSKLKS